MRERRPGCGVLLLPFLLAGCRGSGPSLYSFPKLDIAPGYRLQPSGPRTMEAPTSGSYYTFVRGSFIASVDHLRSRADGGRPDDLLYLETNLNGALDRTVKTERLLQGAFGTVYAARTCFYNRSMQVNGDAVGVGSWMDGGGELPEELRGPPKDLPALTSISLVRIFRAGSDFIVVAGNYEASGTLGSVHVGATKNGEWFSPGDGGNMLYFGKPTPVMARYGIPPAIDLTVDPQRGRLELPEVSLAEELTVLQKQYGWDAVIRQDTLRQGRVSATRWMRSSVTEEQRVLDPPCEAQLEKQREAGQRTVE